MSKKIIILTTPSILTDSGTDYGLLFETANDSHFYKNGFNCIPVTNILKNQEEVRKTACDLTKKILKNEPHFRGIPQFTIFQEAISSELEKAINTIQLHQFVIDAGYTICEFVSPSWWADELNKFVKLINSPLLVKTQSHIKSTRIKRCLNRIYEGKFSLDVLQAELRQILKRIDPFHRRSYTLYPFKKNSFKKNELWFYSTALTYTNIGLVYEPYFSDTFQYLIENPLTGGKPLLDRKRFFTGLYAFGKSEFIPNHNETQAAASAIYHHILKIKLNCQEETARTILLNSAWLKRFFSEFLAYGLFSSSLFENWIQETQPNALVTGNTGFEDYALIKARQHNIPTVLLQHGVLSEYFPYSDHPVDNYIVRGQFFYERLSAESRERALILNPTIKSKPPLPCYEIKQTIIFVTAPFYHNNSVLNIDIDSILLTLLETVSRASAKLIIRVHPREKITDYKIKISRILQKNPLQVNISYSQGNNLETILQEAAVVVMLVSTIFLDCIQYKIPIISFDWYNFSFKEKLKSLSVVYFAENLKDFSALLLKAIHGNLELTTQESNFFLASTPSQVINEKLNSLINSREIIA